MFEEELKNSIKRTILIVEDNELNREMLKVILEDSYNIIEAVDGLDGIEKLNQYYRSLSLILLDVQMPRMNGYEFLEAVNKDAFHSRIPIIVTTGSTISEDEEKCLSLGASDFITKPYNPNVMIRRIEAIIRLHETTDTLQAIEYDALTGLFTKEAFFHHVENLLRYEESDEKAYDILMINVENFSYINERYGYNAANGLLKHIANRLISEAKDSIVTARHIDDRFVLLRNHIDDDSEAECIRFNNAIHENSPISDFTLKYAKYDNIPHNVSLNIICDRLKLALNTIRNQYNKILAFYDDSLSDKENRAQIIQSCMKSSLANNDFKVFYQPKHDVKTGKICGAEALVRWIHPEYGFMSPGDFIPVFESNGFITDLDLFVWEKVCEDMNSFEKEGLNVVPVSVNGSRRDFIVIDNVTKLLSPVEKFGIKKENLHIEITESMSISNDAVLSKVKKIRDCGFKIELDDFGSGESSLGTIDDIPLDIIKLDISFIRAIERKRTVVKMIIALAHELGLKAVAEGVETEEQLNILNELGCDVVQGYYFSKPLPYNEFKEYLRLKND